MTKDAKKRKYCPRCRDEFYNGQNPYGIKDCWHLAESKVEWREIYLSLHSKKPKKMRQLNCYKQQY